MIGDYDIPTHTHSSCHCDVQTGCKLPGLITNFKFNLTMASKQLWLFMLSNGYLLIIFFHSSDNVIANINYHRLNLEGFDKN